MHSRGRGDGCCFWDDDYVLVLFCLDTASYLWFHSKKNTIKKKHHPDRITIPLMDEIIYTVCYDKLCTI